MPACAMRSTDIVLATDPPVVFNILLAPRSSYRTSVNAFSHGTKSAVRGIMFRPDRGEDIEERDYCGPVRESGSTGRSRRS